MSLSIPSRPVQIAHRLADRHPYVVSLLLPIVLWSLVTGFFLLLGLVFRIFHVPSLHTIFSSLQLNLLGEIPLALLITVLISWLGWWSTTGFTHGINGRGLVICIIPFLLIAFPLLISLVASLLKAPSSIITTAVVVSLMVGFVEEGYFRGVILRILLPKGILPSIIFSSLIFACFHAINLISGFPWLYVVEEIVLGIGMGVLFAALRLRTGSIWPLIFLHAIRDIPGLIAQGINPHKALSASLAGVIATGILSLLFILCATVLLRPSQLKKLRVAYGLAPAEQPQVYVEPSIVGEVRSRQ